MGRRREITAGVLAAATTAAVGALGTDPGSEWYRSLRLAAWQPPPWSFGVVWTPLYGTVAWSTARTLAATRGDREARRRYARVLGLDLALNAGWPWAFFRAREPRAAVAEIVALDVVNLVLLRETARHDRPAAAMLAPYVAWCGFATALSTAIARLNRRR